MRKMCDLQFFFILLCNDIPRIKLRPSLFVIIEIIYLNPFLSPIDNRVLIHFLLSVQFIFSPRSYFSVDSDKTSITKRGASINVLPRLDLIRQLMDASGIIVLSSPSSVLKTFNIFICTFTSAFANIHMGTDRQIGTDIRIWYLHADYIFCINQLTAAPPHPYLQTPD